MLPSFPEQTMPTVFYPTKTKHAIRVITLTVNPMSCFLPLLNTTGTSLQAQVLAMKQSTYTYMLSSPHSQSHY